MEEHDLLFVHYWFWKATYWLFFFAGHIVAGCYPDPWEAGYVNEMPLQIMFLSAPKNISFLKQELVVSDMQLMWGRVEAVSRKERSWSTSSRKKPDCKNRKQNKVHQKSKALGNACQEMDLYCWNTGFLHHWRKLLFILSPGCSLREVSLDKTTYIYRKEKLGFCLGILLLQLWCKVLR